MRLSTDEVRSIHSRSNTYAYTRRDARFNELIRFWSVLTTDGYFVEKYSNHIMRVIWNVLTFRVVTRDDWELYTIVLLKFETDLKIRIEISTQGVL